MAQLQIFWRDLPGLSGIKWDKWDSVAEAPLALHATVTPSTEVIGSASLFPLERPFNHTATFGHCPLPCCLAR